MHQCISGRRRFARISQRITGAPDERLDVDLQDAGESECAQCVDDLNPSRAALLRDPPRVVLLRNPARADDQADLCPI
jgi:hypothetical protein